MTLILTVGEATTYFEARLNSSAWTALSDTPDQKTAALTQAQTQLEALYSLDSANEKHKNAVCEQALFLAQNESGADQRAALQAMGVTDAGLVMERYRKTGIFVVPYATAALSGSELAGQSVFVGGSTLTRDDTV